MAPALTLWKLWGRKHLLDVFGPVPRRPICKLGALRVGHLNIPSRKQPAEISFGVQMYKHSEPGKRKSRNVEGTEGKISIHSQLVRKKAT